MPKLTREQKRFLIWLSLTKTHFEVCREVGHSYRKTNGLERYVNKDGEPYKFDTRTLVRLTNEGLVTSEVIFPFGLKYERYYLTNEGRILVGMLRSGAF